jgi:tetratricopeptide (TPR) repeat protein
VPIKAGLTSADLDEIRQSALSTADPLGVAADLADAADDGRLADKNDAGYALALAAEIAESRAKHEAALRYADRAIDAYGTTDDSQVAAVRALRARILFRVGRADEAMVELEPLRALLTQHSDAAAYLSAALAAGGRNLVAEEWLTEAVQAVLNERRPAAADGKSAASIQPISAQRAGGEPASAEEAGLLFFLLQQRHRVRHLLGRSHDQHDNLAERLETRLANASAGPAAAPADDLLFWPQVEFDKLLGQWPALSEAYGKDWDDHRAHLERELVRLTGLGRSGLGPLTATVAGLTSFAGIGSDPADPASRTGYARRLADGSARISWPPERNGSCWCGSGNKYKKCCLPRAR